MKNQGRHYIIQAAGAVASTIIIPLILIMSGVYCSSTNDGQNLYNGGTENGGNIYTSPEIVEKDTAEYTGSYKVQGDPICRLTMTLKYRDNGYVYTLKGDTFTSSGKLLIEKREGNVYFIFTNTFCKGNKMPVEGIYSGNKIIIQNYGNDMNYYSCFRECDSKYIQLVKSE